jgi:O-antigen/teichoic acid export membrane protein
MSAEYFEGVHVVPILLMANFFLGVYYNLTIWYKLTNRNFAGSLIAFAGLLITITLNWIWIPLYGYYGSSWVTFICYGTMMVASYLLGQKFYPVPYDLKRFFIYVLLAYGLYFFSGEVAQALPLSLSFLNYFVGVLLLGSFIGMVYLFETGRIQIFKSMQ